MEDKGLIKLELVQEVVEAKTRKLSARWGVESSSDLSQHLESLGIKQEVFNNELFQAISQDIGVETDQDLLQTLRALPPPPVDANTFDQAKVSGAATTVVDEFAALAVMIGRQANQIATRTRRAKGNWIVVSPTALTILEAARASSPFSRFTPSNSDIDGRPTPAFTKYCGMLNKSMNVFCDSYADESTPVLVGFKGDSEVDGGAYWCPYVFITSHGLVTDPNTFETVTNFYTRYGWCERVSSDAYPGCTADYLGLVGINGKTLSFL